jgi:hypothetical protein
MQIHFGRRTNVRAIRLIGVILGLLLMWLLLERVAVRRAVQPPFAEDVELPADVSVVEKQQPVPRQTIAPQPCCLPRHSGVFRASSRHFGRGTPEDAGRCSNPVNFALDNC